MSDPGEERDGSGGRAGSRSSDTYGFEQATEFRLRMSLRSTPAERLRDLEAMIDFNAVVESKNPRVKRVAERLRNTGEDP